MIRNIVADIRPLYAVSLEHAKLFIDWVFKLRDKTHFDPVVMRHPRMCIATASDENGPVLMIPFSSVIMFDCLAPRPDANKRELAYAMWQIGEQVEKAMIDTGNCEAFFYTNNENLAESVVKHGWDEVKNVRLMRKRIAAPTLPAETAQEETHVESL